MNYISLLVAIASLIVSAGTFWLVFFQRGRLRMTTPTVVFFGYDHIPHPTAKIFIRTLLFCTAARGTAIEGMYAKVSLNGEPQIFSFWGYGETDKLTVGSGLHISQSGFAANHHFVASVKEDAFEFAHGEYMIEIFARVIGKHKPVKLQTIRIQLTDDLSAVLRSREGVLFERSIDGIYMGHAQNHI